MIKKIILENYRCYQKHEIDFNKLSIIVGKNNAGKSTLIEALRLVSLVTNKYKNLAYKSQPNWTNLTVRCFGISPSIKGIDFSLKNIFYKNASSPGKISIIFLNNSKIDIFINSDGELFAILYDKNGLNIRDKKLAISFSLPTINILPQIGPLKEEETFLNEEYVKSSIYSSHTSLHFRNQLLNFEEFYSKFVSLSQKTWEGLKIKSFQKGDRLYDINPELIIEDDGFETEVGQVGHGLQMWLQTMWFIARCNQNSTIILDEPDVYLHADMQRKLIKFLKDKFNQTIIATHSIEIISEVEPNNIVIVNKTKQKSKPITSVQAVQKIIEHIGSIQNIELIRYWSSGKLLIVEGDPDDIKLLKIFQLIIFPDSKIPFDLIPKDYSNGWGGWQKIIGMGTVKKGSDLIKIYCIFDSDYHVNEEKTERKIEAKKNKIELHIWSKKEIENYLINPSVIFRLINSNHKKEKPTELKIHKKIESLIELEKDYIIDNFSDEIRKWKKNKQSTAFCNTEARKIVKNYWTDLDNKISISPGKKILKEIIKWSDKEFGYKFSKFELAKSFKKGEINSEIKSVISAIEEKKDFK